MTPSSLGLPTAWLALPRSKDRSPTTHQVCRGCRQSLTVRCCRQSGSWSCFQGLVQGQEGILEQYTDRVWVGQLPNIVTLGLAFVFIVIWSSSRHLTFIWLLGYWIVCYGTRNSLGAMRSMHRGSFSSMRMDGEFRDGGVMASLR